MSLGGCLIGTDQQESGGQLFLNCTKNIELTGALFARTVTLTMNRQLVLAASRRRATFDGAVGEIGHSGLRAMNSEEWKTYRTRFLVKAKQLSSSLSFVDNLGRQHSGRKGDYLVESSEGVISIAPRQIFEDIYVAMALENQSGNPGEERRKLPQPWRDRRGLSSRVGIM